MQVRPHLVWSFYIYLLSLLLLLYRRFLSHFSHKDLVVISFEAIRCAMLYAFLSELAQVEVEIHDDTCTQALAFNMRSWPLNISSVMTPLSYDVAVIQCMTSCHKNRMTTLCRERVTSLTTFVSTIRFLNEIMLILKAIKSHFKGSYDKQNLILVVLSYKIYETRRRLVS